MTSEKTTEKLSQEDLSEAIAQLQAELAQKNQQLKDLRSKIKTLKEAKLYYVEVDEQIRSDDEEELRTGYDLKELVEGVSDCMYATKAIPKSAMKIMSNNNCCCCQLCTQYEKCNCKKHSASQEGTKVPGAISDTDTLGQSNKKMEKALDEEYPQYFDYGYDDYGWIKVVSGDFFREFIKDLEKDL